MRQAEHHSSPPPHPCFCRVRSLRYTCGGPPTQLISSSHWKVGKDSPSKHFMKRQNAAKLTYRYKTSATPNSGPSINTRFFGTETKNMQSPQSVGKLAPCAICLRFQKRCFEGFSLFSHRPTGIRSRRGGFGTQV